MTQKQVLRKLIDLLTNEMKTFDFEPVYSEQGFVRKNSNAIFLFQFLIYNRTLIETGVKGFMVEPYIWINIREIEKYYREITLNKEIKNDTDFKTLGNSIASLLANPDGLYKNRNKSLSLMIFEEKDILFVADQLLKVFKEVALPYCLNNSTVAMADKLVNTRPGDYKVNMPNDNYRIVKGIIAAKLNANPNLSDLIKIYDKQLIDREMQDVTKEEMSRLKAILPMIGTNSRV